jgi:hypothetical protein
MPVEARRPSVATRRSGYVIAAAIIAAMWYVLNVWPGWQQVPFLTDETSQVLWLVNFSLLINITVNAVYLAFDPPWFKALGELVTTVIGLAVLAQIWRIFPFDFSGTTVNWAFIARFVLVLAIVGAAIGIVVQLVTLVRLAVDGGVPVGHRREVHR